MVLTSAAPTDPDLALLTGEATGELMAPVLAQVGGTPEHWRTTYVDHRPGRRTTVSYAVRVRWPDGSLTDETLAACSGPLPDGTVRLSDGRTEIAMWRFPHDPDLPALRIACDPERMRRLAADVGFGTAGPVRLRVRAYRPRRRAVVEVCTPNGSLFVKVVRPGQARGLHERHRIAATAGCPVPASLGWTGQGLVALAAVEGRCLRDVLTDDTPAEIDADGVAGILDTLPAELATGDRGRTWGQRAPHYAGVIAAVLPEVGDRVEAIADAVDHEAPEGADVAVHGDFYESQLMVGAGRVSGLLDLDTAGRGERLDDAGCLLAHLSVLAQIRPARVSEINAFGLRLWQRFLRDLDSAALARRAAAVVLSLATGPHRVQQDDWAAHTIRRVALAEWWLETGPR